MLLEAQCSQEGLFRSREGRRMEHGVEITPYVDGVLKASCINAGFLQIPDEVCMMGLRPADPREQYIGHVALPKVYIIEGSRRS